MELFNELCEFEKARLLALVNGDTDAALEFHHQDFQLITPRGHALTRTQYLGEIAIGGIRYLSWVPQTMSVRGDAMRAVVRYRASIEMESDGNFMPKFECWHTDYYERQNDRWMVVWSQATQIG